MSSKQTYLTMAVIVLIATLVQLSTDIYTPSIPAIAADLKTSIGQVQLTMATLMAGVAMTNLIYGPLSEGIGRRRTIMIGIGIALVGTLVCVFSHSVLQLQIGRFIQGCGLGACNALWRSVFRDCFSGDELARVSSYLVNFVILSLIIAPFIGGYIQHYLGWHAVFIILFAWMVVVFLFVAKFFQETSQHHGAHRLNIGFVFKTYHELLTHKRFIGFCAMTFCTYGGLFAWITSAPVVFIHRLGLSSVEFGYLMIASGVATGVGGFLNAKLTKKLSLHRIMVGGLSGVVLSGLLMLVSTAWFGVTVLAVLVPALVFVVASTLVFMNCFVLAFEDVGHIAGYAGSVYASIQLLGGAVFALILSHLNTNSPLPMAWMFVGAGLVSSLVLILLRK